jgi:hypothetical protein
MNHEPYFSWTRFAIIVAGLFSVSATYAQTTVTLNGNNYTLVAHPRVLLDGPSGPLSLALQDASNRAQGGNPAYAAMQSSANAAVAESVCSTGANTYSGNNCPGLNIEYVSGGDSFGRAADAAMMWWVQGGPSQSPIDPHGYLAFAINSLTYAEDIASGSFACDQTQNNCGRTAYDVFNPMLFNQIWTVYTIVRSQMTSAQITTFANKMLNDNSTSTNGIGGSEASPTTSCTVQSITPGTGTITPSGNVVTGVRTHFTTQLAVGDVLFWPASTYTLGHVYQIVSDTEVIMSTTVSNAAEIYAVTTPVNTTSGSPDITVASNASIMVGMTLTGSGLPFPAGTTVLSISGNNLVVSNDATATDSSLSVNFLLQTWSHASAWAPGDCGLKWLQNHHGDFPPITPGQVSTCPADYPTSGCNAAGIDENITSMAVAFAIRMGLALADDDSRAGTLLTNAYNWYYNYMYPGCKMGWDGFNEGGNEYGVGTWGETVPEIAVVVRNSVSGGAGSAIDLTPGYYISRYAPLMYYGAQPNDSAYTSAVWGDGGSGGGIRAMHNLRGAFTACYISGGPTGPPSPDCQGFNYYLRILRGDYGAGAWGEASGVYAWQFYIFYNYNGTAATPTTQYVFKDNDITYAQCAATFTGMAGMSPPPGSTNANPCTANQYWGNMFSLSDWTTHATQLLVKSGWERNGQDHTTNIQQGAFHIFRNGSYLIGGDQGSADGFLYGNADYESNIDLNSTWNKMTSGNANGYLAAYVPVIRWSGPDPTGDPSSRYAYEMLDLVNSGAGLYTAGSHATRVQRQIVHFKKSGGQDYIVTWDDVAFSSALSVAPKAYFHYFLNGVAPGTAISYSGADYTVSNLQAASSALLNSQFVPTAGANTAALVVDNANGTYTGGNGSTFRAYMCPSQNGTTCNNGATSGEWAGVFQPINGSNGTMPAITQLTPTESGNFRVIQIADSTYPKVAAFATGGSVSNTALHVTTTHSGTGQYLVTGLSPGTYSVSLNSASILSNQTVNSGDDTLYFESSSGSIAVTQTGAAPGNPILSCDLNGNGVVNVQDVQISVNAVLGLIPCLPQYELDGSGTCTVIDVQRVANAVLGLGCVIGQ